MRPGEAYFIGHCDEVDCSLGTFEYKCPVCFEFNTDYVLWWEEDEIWKGKVVTFNCPDCGEELVIEWEQENCQYIVRKK